MISSMRAIFNKEYMDMYENIKENYDISKTSKNTFRSIFCLFLKQYFEISGKTYYHGNDITNTTPPSFFSFREA